MDEAIIFTGSDNTECTQSTQDSQEDHFLEQWLANQTEQSGKVKKLIAAILKGQ